MNDRGVAAALGQTLETKFYERTADVVAPELLGKHLVVRDKSSSQVRCGRIVETEAYVGQDDLACHASKGLTARTSTIFGHPAHAYVYLIYGMYDMFNVVVAPAGVPHAVLVRAVELPEDLVPRSADGGRSGTGAADARTASGPGKLTRALGITRAEHNGVSLLGPEITIVDGPSPAHVGVSARVGVAYAGRWADEPLRYFDAASPAVSRPSPRQLGSGGL